MHIAKTVDNYRHARYTLFKWIDEASIAYKLSFSLAFACLTGIMAQVRITLPFTPVPVTGQVLAVLLSGILLGGYYGGLSQIFYLGLGAFGVPWFSAAGAGLGVLNSVVGGYIIGFIPSAFVIGWLTRRYVFMRRFHFQLIIMAIGVGIIYLLGAIQFSLVMHTGFTKTIQLAVLPFIPVDLMKSALAACTSASILPKKSQI